MRLIPHGKVASYGQVAAYVGTPRAARQVGWTMSSMENISDDFPWWRVLNNAGKITIRGNMHATGQLQKELLEAEGVAVNDAYELDMHKHRWRPDPETLAGLKLPPEHIEKLLKKYDLGNTLDL